MEGSCAQRVFLRRGPQPAAAQGCSRAGQIHRNGFLLYANENSKNHVTNHRPLRHTCVEKQDRNQVVVIGAGLAGLTAATTVARARKPVVVVEAHAGGGRARTDERQGYRFNQGPHALFRGGETWRVLGEFGVSRRGHMPPVRGARGVRDGKVVRVIGQAMRLMGGWLMASPEKWAGRNAEEWVDSLKRGRDVSELARMFVRVSTYASNLHALPADLAISQLKSGFRGVTYLDGGWASLVNGVSSAATAAGAILRTHEPATGVSATPGGWQVDLAGGKVLPASSVVIAAGSPATVRKLLPIDPGWQELGPPVTAACLDLGLKGRRPAILYGVDEPLYLSRHCPPGDLAPQGGSLVHVMRYGARGARQDRADLRSYARLAGISDDQIVEERYLANMVVTHVLPRPEHGLAGRPRVDVPGAEGIYIAGDWVGPMGWLADAAVASGQRAGRLATESITTRKYPKVA